MKTTEQMQQELQNKFPFLELAEDYKGANEKILIRCKDCGYEWKAIPRSVLNSKHGCSKCKLNQSKHERAKQNFLKKLDTEKWEFMQFNSPSDVMVKCKICGNIRHTTSDNILRFGCKRCSSRIQNEPFKLTTEEFITRARKIHSDKYDYSKVVYINYKTPVIIICPEHGEFLQTPNKHLSGHGCPKCAGRNWNTEDFIKKAREIHGDKYDYSKVKFAKMIEKVCIVCPEHGEFWQSPQVHLYMKCGCPKCSQSHGERIVSQILNNLGVTYNIQCHIQNPYNSNKFVVDFYLLYNNEQYIIEYNGEQHYRPVNFFGGEERFEKQVARDTDLAKYCLENNIHLITLEYFLTDQEIQEKLSNLFTAVPIEESQELLLGKNGEGCDANTVLTESITQGDSAVQSIESE